MHLLLPPSENKSVGGRGRALRTRLGEDGALGRGRTAALRALGELIAGDPARAADALLLPPGVAVEALATNAAVFDSPTTPALRRYAGTVYDGFAVSTLRSDEQRYALRSTLIFSGLFGVVRGDEPVPAYRVPAKAVLPGLGVASTFWRPLLVDVLGQILRRGLVVDLRSSDYAAMWRPSPAMAQRVVPVRVLSPAPHGGHAVISYNSKHAKGRLAAELVRRAVAGIPVDTADDVAEAWMHCGGVDWRAGRSGGLDLYSA
ncbi:MAG: uncharacterized protein QOC66_1106 [Pseudonocardiales bacterium]|nr:uncharacterized protein [Pseudonocardiales bacterium]